MRFTGMFKLVRGRAAQEATSMADMARILEPPVRQEREYKFFSSRAHRHPMIAPRITYVAENPENTIAGTYNRIGLMDHMGFGNMGDAAIQESLIANIRRRIPTAQLVAFSSIPEDTRQRHNLESYPIFWSYQKRDGSDASPARPATLTSWLKQALKGCRPFYAVAKPVHDLLHEIVHLIRSYSTVKSLDLLLVAGGGQLCELWRTLPYNVFKFCVLAKLSNTPLFIVSVGAGPLTRPLNKTFARWSVRLADYASFRDVESQALLHSLGVTRETYVYPDPVYALDLRGYLRIEPSKLKRVKVGLNPMGFCDPRLWPRKDAAVYRHYLDKVASFSTWLLGRDYDLEVFTSDISVDKWAIEDLKKRLIGDGRTDLVPRVVFRPVLDLQELLRQMADFQFVVTSKFHGVVFSHLLCKPVIALSYHHKIDDLMRAVGHDEYCLDIEHFGLQGLIEAFSRLVVDSEKLQCRFREATMAYQKVLDGQFDNLFGKRSST
jgi:polysaccharide pyruvyl transferase WcaK-like protein